MRPQEVRAFAGTVQLVGGDARIHPGSRLQTLGSSPLRPYVYCLKNVSLCPCHSLPLLTFHIHLVLVEVICLDIRVWKERK